MSNPSFLMDADSFIRSKREHYAPDFCPAFWDAIVRGFKSGSVKSIAPIRKELLRGSDALAVWVRGDLPEQFFCNVDDESVQEAYAEIIQWAEVNAQYTRAAKQAFAKSADPWLIAYARACGNVIVTYGVSSPTSKSTIQLPDAARAFGVTCIPPYVMLRQLQVRFRLDEHP